MTDDIVEHPQLAKCVVKFLNMLLGQVGHCNLNDEEDWLDVTKERKI